MLTQQQITEVMGATAYDQSGDKIGKVGQVYLDDETNQPSFATVNTGFFGTNESFVPLDRAEFNGDRLSLPYSKEKVKGAPNVALDGHISDEEMDTLYRYYELEGRGYSSGAGETGTDTWTGTDQTTAGTYSDTDQTTAGIAGTGTYADTAETGGTDDAMTRSEETVNVAKRREQVGRARLRKYVTTEHVNVSVPVREERAVLEREPVTEANRGEAFSGQDITEAEHEVVLNREVPEVQKRTEPVERVRLGTEEVTTEETVNEQVRKEQIEVEGDVDRRGL